MPITALQSTTTRTMEAFIKNKAHTPENNGSITDIVELGDSCTPEIRKGIADLRIVKQQKRKETLQAAGKIRESGNREPEKEWTILHYGGADNNLSKYWIETVNEMEAVGSRENLNIVSQLDLRDEGCKRYYITGDNDPQHLTSPVLEDLGRVNMADPEVLTEFIKFGVKKYPAKHYLLIIASHGAAWKGLQLEESFYHGGMSVPTLQKSIENAEKTSGRKLDLLAFDACEMGSTEAAYELRIVAYYLVASEQVEAFKSWPYTSILQKAFEEKKTVAPRELGSIIVDESSKVKQDMLTMGLIDLSRMENVKDAANAFAVQILETKTSMKKLNAIAEQTQQFYDPFKDLHHFSQKIAASPAVKDTTLIKAAENLCSTLKDAVITEEHSTSVPPRDLITDSDILALNEKELHSLYELSNAHGLNVELNPQSSSYDDLQFAKDTQWGRAMSRINQVA